MDTLNCWACNQSLSHGVYEYSLNEFEIPLCIPCQERVRPYVNEFTSPETIVLWIALCDAGLPARLEQFDGHKTIDIAIPTFRLNIEVDGHHHHGPKQALADLKRTAYSLQHGFITLRIPNSLVTQTSNYQFIELIESIKAIAHSAKDRLA